MRSLRSSRGLAKEVRWLSPWCRVREGQVRSWLLDVLFWMVCSTVNEVDPTTPEPDSVCTCVCVCVCVCVQEAQLEMHNQP